MSCKSVHWFTTLPSHCVFLTTTTKIDPSKQWRTQEFCSGAGFNKFGLGQRTERTGIWGR